MSKCDAENVLFLHFCNVKDALRRYLDRIDSFGCRLGLKKCLFCVCRDGVWIGVLKIVDLRFE